MQRKLLALNQTMILPFTALLTPIWWPINTRKQKRLLERRSKSNRIFAGYFGTLAATLGQQGHWRAALEAAETGLQLDPENENCARIRAHALSLAGRSKDAVVAAQETIEENPDSSHAHATLGWVRLRQGDHKAAQSHFAEALRLDPSEELAREGLLDSLRSRFPPYRWIIQFYAWQAQFSKGGQLVIFIAILAIPRILRAIGRNNPQWQPFLIPIGVCFSFLIWFTWIGEPLTNITLLAHPLGRLALEKHVRFETIVMAIYLGLALVSFGLGFLFGPGVFIAAGCLFVGLVLMALLAKIDSTRWLRHALFGGTAALSGIAAIAFWLISFIKL